MMIKFLHLFSISSLLISVHIFAQDNNVNRLVFNNSETNLKNVNGVNNIAYSHSDTTIIDSTRRMIREVGYVRKSSNPSIFVNEVYIPESEKLKIINLRKGDTTNELEVERNRSDAYIIKTEFVKTEEEKIYTEKEKIKIMRANKYQFPRKISN